MIIKWLDEAINDLQQIKSYIKKDNPQASTRIAKKNLSAVGLLENNSGMGRPGRIHGTRELIIAGTAYIVPYRVKENTIEILRVLHGVKMWPSQFIH